MNTCWAVAIQTILTFGQANSNDLLRHEVVNPDGEQEHLQICKIYHNGDKNAVQNMISIVEELKKTGKRPLRFTRKIVEAN